MGRGVVAALVVILLLFCPTVARADYWWGSDTTIEVPAGAKERRAWLGRQIAERLPDMFQPSRADEIQEVS